MMFVDDRGREYPCNAHLGRGAFAWYQDILRRGLPGRFFSAPGKFESRGDMLAVVLRGTLPEGQKLF